MNSVDLGAIEVDLGRVTAGLRRSWWMVVVGALAGAILVVVFAPRSTSTESEFRESDSRAQLERIDLTITPFESIVDVMNTSRFRDAVEKLNGRSVPFSATLTPSGQIGFSVPAESSAEGDRLADLVYDVLNETIGGGDRLLIGDRITYADAVIDDFENEIDAIRSSGSDEIAETLERSSLVGLLATEQLAKSRLEATVGGSFVPVTEIRRTTTTAGVLKRAAIALIGGALLGSLAAVANSLLRRRIGSIGGLRTVVPNTPAYQLGNLGRSDDATAIVSGAVRRAGHRHASPLHVIALGDLAAQVLASARVALPQLGDDQSADARIALVDISTPFADIAACDPHDGVIVVARPADSIRDGQDQVSRIDAAGLPILASVLTS